MLEVNQVSKLYENERGVRNIDFSMSRGEIVGFLGPNGAGKTTTMRMITGYLNPTKGTIRVDGLSMADHPRKARRKIGYLPETPPLYPEMTVSSYLKFVANLRDVPVREQKQRIGEVIEKLGLQGREKQVIRGLSKGYKQRLGLAQAIVHKPDLLIMDEPTSGLDPKQIIEIRQLIRDLGENHTVLLSTHILPEVNAICNRVLIINQGRIVLDEHPEHIAGSMGESFEVRLEVKGPKEDVKRELLELPGVGSVKELERESAGMEPETALLRVVSKDRADIREAVFYRMAERGYPILEMKKESLSLEDIFLKLTTDEKEVAESGLQDEQEQEQKLEHQQPEVEDRA
ncbi:ABC transporter ATP-binding protein [Paenibacillus flagellatus]|uniref:Multidrug ABC transporter ATP-binding protein n=1 Tax=Paenibacillus flagellatus TaxID=2211139 RepID=A0A2V5JX49_9BACL|nr:ATP-binding cassette domain-containing protein [Paenibacillus flagellatus]PYI51221.1 multidrug ABC transporter ATP-binding protein [Paenibacillus flagellatus]